MRDVMTRASLLSAVLLALVPPAQAGERTVTDESGRSVDLPPSIERVVVLHEPLLGLPLMDLGVTPVGSYGRDDTGAMLTRVDFVETVMGPDAPKPETGIGAIGNIDLEKLDRIAPDLILGTEYDVDKADRLSSVAPVYLKNVSTGLTSGFDIEADLAKLFGLEDRFQARKADYLAKVKDVQAVLPETDKPLTYLAIFVTDQVNVIGQMSGAIQALEDVGYQRADIGSLGEVAGSGRTLFNALNPEAFIQLDPDVLVLMRSYSEADRSEAATRARIDQIAPGWQHFLKPAKDGRLLFLDSAQVTTPTIASAEHTLDALKVWLQR